MKKKIILTLAALALVGALVVGGTLAWFTDEATVANIFTAGTVDVSIFENEEESSGNINFDDDWLPGDETDKVVTFQSNGKSATLLRVKITPAWDPQLSVDNVILNISTNGWTELQADGYYYYKEVLEQNDVTTALLNSVKLASSTGNAYQGATLTVNIVAEAIQAANDAYQDAWSLSAPPAGCNW